MEGHFTVSNCEDEKAMIQAFYGLIKRVQPHILVTFNGDFFDFPYVAKRSEILGLDMMKEIGVYKISQGAEEYFAGRSILHIDCYAWVQRDSYLPQGAQGLKMVTKYKLKYDPVELDPEDIAPFARTNPQELASYSVSDALATYFLFKKYIQDFIFALCTVIPTQGDEVLRKGSGTLCEMLLMAEAFQANVVFPNKHTEEALQYHNGRLIETSTYEGGRVECLRTGIYRDDFPEKFNLDVNALHELIGDVENIIDFFLEKESSVKKQDVVNYESVVAEIKKILSELAESPSRSEEPLIYHLDVAAMYPNIILSNRLQPSAIVSKDACAACSFNKDADTNECQRKMAWKWRGDLYKATKADVQQIQRELEAPAHRYNSRDNETGEVSRVPWKELGEKDKHDLLIRNVRTYSTKAYKRVKSPVTEDRTDIVCQRENGFYIDTVRAFRDRRYEFKDATKNWKSKLEHAESAGDIQAISQAKDMILLFDSLQLAHKCILNSFYGYVMRKGARWHSMKMAGIVTFTGSNLIREAREFVDRMGLPLELDTDGIWCLLPKSFPDRFKLELKSGKCLTMTLACSLLNVRVHRKYSNHQYQTLDKGTGEWKRTTENSIFFEIDGPYKAMVIPASTEEDRMLKKRYAVFNFDGSIAELKGFEIKRRGELKLVQVFQENVFPAFLEGKNREEVYAAVGRVANRWIHVLDTRGAFLADSELIGLISERKNMSKSVEDSGDLKSASITTARRIASFLGESILREKGIACHLVIANRPVGASATERAIPIQIFSADESVKRSFLRKWLNDPFMTDYDIRAVIDWEYYRTRLGSTVQKLVIIPALEQRIPNPCPSIPVVDWMKRKIAIQNDKFQQTNLTKYFGNVTTRVKPIDKPSPVVIEEQDIEVVEMGGHYDEENISPPELQVLEAEVAESNDIEEQVAGPRISDGQVEEWASWQKSKWKQMRSKRTEVIGKSRNTAQQSSLTQDILRASAAGLATIGGSGIKNRRLGVMPWHVLKIEQQDDESYLDLWVTLGDVIQKISIPYYRKQVVLFPNNTLASEVLNQLPRNCTFRELSASHTSLPPSTDDREDFLKPGTLFELSCPSMYWLSDLGDKLSLSGASVFESGFSSTFDYSARFGAVAQIRDMSRIPEAFYSSLSLIEGYDSEVSQYSILKDCKESYLTFQDASSSGAIKPLFVHFAETTSPSVRAFACVFAEKAVFVGFVGVPPPQRPTKTAIEKLISDELIASQQADQAELPPVVIEHIESGFFDTLTFLTRAVNKYLDETLRRVGAFHTVCVLSSDPSSNSISPILNSVKSVPICRSPFSQMDAAFPALDWARWAMKRWATRAPRLLDWWEDRLWLARISRIPLCQFPANREAYSYALDVLLARALREEVKMVLWNNTQRLNGSEAEAEAMAILSPERSERVTCQEVSNPGIYRSVCLSLNLKSSLCVAALSRASQLALERGLAQDKQLEALFSLVESLVQRGRLAQQRVSKMTPVNEMQHRHTDGSKLAAAEAEVRICASLLGGLYSWLSNPGSQLFSPELLSKTTQAMNQTLELLIDQLTKSGCQIVYANFSKVVFATGKSSVADVASFWTSLRLNLAEHAILRGLSLDESSVAHAMFGLMWFDSSNYACIPVDRSGEISWRVEAQWKIGECLPPALRAPFYTYTSEFLMKPMKALMKLSSSSSGSMGNLTNAQKLSELTLYVLNSAIPQIRKKLYNFISDVEVKRQNDMVVISAVLDEEDDEDDQVRSDDSDFEDPPEVRRKRRINELRSKWEFPSLPGVSLPAATRTMSPAVEFAKFIWEMISLERIDARAIEDIAAMRNDLLKFFKVSPFSPAAVFENPIRNISGCCLQNVPCQRCGETSTHVDVVAGPFQGPGLWECTLCGGVYDRDLMETRLVGQVQTIARGWQTQTLRCEKCKRAKTRFLAKYCQCSGKYQTRIEKQAAIDAIKVTESVAVAHNLPWLEQTCKFYLNRI
jgi:DNA polymerase epsilon subunit 1